MSNYVHHFHSFINRMPAGEELHVDMVGTLRSLGRHRFEQYFNGLCFHAVRKGKGVFRVDGRDHAAAAGDVFVFWPGKHYFYHDFPETPWQFVYVSVAGRRKLETLRKLGFQEEEPLIRPTADSEFWRYLSDLVARAESGGTGPAFPAAGAWRFLELLTEALGWNQAEALDSEEVVEVCARLLDSHPGEFLGVAELAERFEVNRSTLYRAFKARYGLSPQEYQVRRRLGKARQLLRGTRLSVKQVAALCGFKQAAHFNTLFKRHVGHPPARWRSLQATATSR